MVPQPSQVSQEKSLHSRQSSVAGREDHCTSYNQVPRLECHMTEVQVVYMTVPQVG